jgi:hypothetical protein
MPDGRKIAGGDAMGAPHYPGCFEKRGCKLLKTKRECCKKRGKRVQERAKLWV